MKLIQKCAGAVMITSLIMASYGWAYPSQDQAQGYVGGQFGLSVPNEQGTNAREGFGFTGGAKLSDELGVGGFYFNSSHSEGSAANGFTFGYQVYGVEGDYYFDGSGTGAYFGASLGFAKVAYSDSVGNEFDYSPIAYGIQGGYDYPLFSHFSLGAEISMLFIGGGDESVNGVSHHLDGFEALNFLGSAKFWF